MKKPPSIKQEQKAKAMQQAFNRRERDKARLAGITTMILIICVLFMFIYSILQSM
jgi:cobalamin biosynthesis protein CobD/CbiB